MSVTPHIRLHYKAVKGGGAAAEFIQSIITTIAKNQSASSHIYLVLGDRKLQLQAAIK
jgi:hypothetical protein